MSDKFQACEAPSVINLAVVPIVPSIFDFAKEEQTDAPVKEVLVFLPGWKVKDKRFFK